MSHVVHQTPAHHGHRPASLMEGIDRVIDTISQWRMRMVTRRDLARLDDRMLADIGISPADVDQEVSKHFWQA
ncbi:uncharacterized protein YjiS (DUF1127 family) [Azospirillum fermentarium]|uniref:DUF1127 domain-containing protein n=1 Tax=Azospirillum fermentarium TaxID=1233114 RepID=UPI002226F377|nr:DUF1127 domain-containing protein [Azospirillum fermentarium]MCW2245671.1 uncharacterized protein YjiS (DUF1127 family) [Azospirillum fermentarium]